MKLKVHFLLALLFTFNISFSQTILTNGTSFTPDTIVVNVGDTITFNLGGNHNAVEVDESNWIANDTTYNGGFYFALGSSGGYFIADSARTYYYVCQPHADSGMKGVIIVNFVTYGCTDSTATNYDPFATIDDGSCIYPLPPADNLFFSEYAEGSSNNKYFEIYNPTNDTVDLTNYAFARVNNSPTTNGVYEYWVDFDSAAIILPNDVYVVAHPSVDSLILLETDMEYGSLSNGDDGFALVYGINPGSPMSPSAGGYQILDWIGDWNGDPGQGWEVDGVVNATRNHSLIRKCPISVGDTSWSNSSANQWVVKPIDYWLDLGTHNWMTSVTDSLSYTICNGLSVTIGSSTYSSSGVYSDILISQNGCDSIVITTLTVLSNSASIVVNNFTICDGDSVVVDSNSYFTSGTYVDSLINNSGCDSIITTHLIVQTPTYQSFTICYGDSIAVGNSVYNSTGNYTDTIQSSIGCDSIVHTNLIIYSQFNSVFGGIVSNSVGTGGIYTGNRHHELNCFIPTEIVSAIVYSQDTNIITFELRDDNGNVISDTTQQLIPGSQRVYLNFEMPVGTDLQLGVSSAGSGLYRNNSGANYPYNFGGLASITGTNSSNQNYYYFLYDIEMRASSQSTNYSICDGDSITVAGNVYNTTGVYTDSLISSIGCDSLVFTNLVVYPNAYYTNNQTICNGETYVLNGNIYDSTGMYTDSLVTIHGCDSIVTTILIVDSISGGSSFNNQTICLGDSVSVGTSTYYTSGTYSDTLISINGCDSVVTTSVNIFIVTATNQQTICIGDSVSIGNNTYYYSGVYSDTLITLNGCDSVVTTYLNIISANYNTISGGLLDTITGSYSNYNGHLLLDATVTSLLKSATVYSTDTNVVTFELRDDNGVVLQDVTHTVYPGSQSLVFNFIIPVGFDYELGINGGNSGLYRNDAGSGNSIAYPFNMGPVNITSSNAGNQYYYFYYDIEIQPFVSYNPQFICEGDSVVVGSNIYDTPGSYLNTFISSNSCDSLVNTVLSYFQSPPLNISSSPNPAEICLGDTITLEGSTGFDQYYWISENAVIGQNQQIELSPSQDFWYLLKAIDSNGCVSNEDIMVYVDTCATSVDELLFTNISVYPNPSTGIFTLKWDNTTNKNSTLKVMNSVGEEVYSEILMIGENEKQINISKFSKGIYLLEIETKNRIINKKLIVQ